MDNDNAGKVREAFRALSREEKAKFLIDWLGIETCAAIAAHLISKQLKGN